LPTPSSLKRQARKDKFVKLNTDIAVIKAGDHYDGRDYHTGQTARFSMSRGDTTFEMFADSGQDLDIGFGPEFCTPQWVRTTKE